MQARLPLERPSAREKVLTRLPRGLVLAVLCASKSPGLLRKPGLLGRLPVLAQEARASAGGTPGADGLFAGKYIEMQFAYHASSPLRVCRSTAFSVFTELCSPHHSQFWSIVTVTKETLRPLPIPPRTPFSLAPNTTRLLPVSMDVPIPDTSCKWNQTYVIFCDWLLSLNLLFSGFSHGAA